MDYNYILIDRLYRRLSDQDGILLAQTDDTFDDYLRAWVDRINATKGLEANCQTLSPKDGALKSIIEHQAISPRSSAVRITKHAGAPARLPTLGDEEYSAILPI